MKRYLPAYPLFVKDPYFSLWSPCEELNAEDVIFWTGHKKKMYGIIKVDGVPYSFLGKFEGIKKAAQTSLSVNAFSTDYEFVAGGATLKLSFASPLLLDDPDLLSCPVCYMKYEVCGASDVQIILALDENICYNEHNTENEVRGGIIALDSFNAAFFGLSRQKPFSNNDDSGGADWGNFYLSGEKTYFTDEAMFKEFVLKGLNPQIPERQSIKYIVSLSQAQRGAVMVAFDDTVSINYFGDYLKGYYLENKTILDALSYVYANITEIDDRLNKFGQSLRERSAKFGDEYYNILCASLRQSVAAHKLVRTKKGDLLFLSKECHSNGCIATVDVSYPSIPLYLLYNPELVRGMLRPIFAFAKMPVWEYDFAPHDAGTYPNCTGQVYGLNEHKNKNMSSVLTCWEHQTRFPLYLLPKGNDIYCFENQMPVEECANMIVMVEACHKADGKLTLARENFELLNKWADYLAEHGLKPANQLCTDDFAGHLGNNLNLAIKATVGIACFAEICKALNNEKYSIYRKTAEDFAGLISASITESGLPLTWGGAADTFSLKYNFAFDKILGLGLFNQKLLEREVDLYLSKMNAYGTPLDSRKDYTKSDWLMWAARLTDDIGKKKILIRALNDYLKETPDRKPFSDWYDTVTGKSVGFCNRTVQGGCFILLL